MLKVNYLIEAFKIFFKCTCEGYIRSCTDTLDMSELMRSHRRSRSGVQRESHRALSRVWIVGILGALELIMLLSKGIEMRKGSIEYSKKIA